MSQMYLTSFFDDLAQMMNGAADKLSRAKRGLLLPSEYSKSLKPLDPYASSFLLAPLFHLFLRQFLRFCLPEPVPPALIIRRYFGVFIQAARQPYSPL